MEDKKFCKFCGEKIDKEAIVCSKCGRQLNVLKKEEEKKEEKQTEIQEKPKFYTKTWFMWILLFIFPPAGIFFMWKFHPEMKKKTKIILTIVFTIFFLIVFVNTDTETDKDVLKSNSSAEKSPSDSNKNKFSLGDTFEFDKLELTLDKDYSFVKVKNQFSEHDGKSVIKLGVNVKNVSSEKNKLNMFYYDLFGSKGTELSTITAYFDDSIDFAGDLKPGASYKTYFYLLYDGDGKYSIDFDKFLEEKTVEFEVKK